MDLRPRNKLERQIVPKVTTNASLQAPTLPLPPIRNLPAAMPSVQAKAAATLPMASVSLYPTQNRLAVQANQAEASSSSRIQTPNYDTGNDEAGPESHRVAPPAPPIDPQPAMHTQLQAAFSPHPKRGTEMSRRSGASHTTRLKPVMPSEPEQIEDAAVLRTWLNVHSARLRSDLERILELQKTNAAAQEEADTHNVCLADLRIKQEEAVLSSMELSTLEEHYQGCYLELCIKEGRRNGINAESVQQYVEDELARHDAEAMESQLLALNPMPPLCDVKQPLPAKAHQTRKAFAHTAEKLGTPLALKRMAMERVSKLDLSTFNTVMDEELKLSDRLPINAAVLLEHYTPHANDLFGRIALLPRPMQALVLIPRLIELALARETAIHLGEKERVASIRRKIEAHRLLLEDTQAEYEVGLRHIRHWLPRVYLARKFFITEKRAYPLVATPGKYTDAFFEGSCFADFFRAAIDNHVGSKHAMDTRAEKRLSNILFFVLEFSRKFGLQDPIRENSNLYRSLNCIQGSPLLAMHTAILDAVHSTHHGMSEEAQESHWDKVIDNLHASLEVSSTFGLMVIIQTTQQGNRTSETMVPLEWIARDINKQVTNRHITDITNRLFVHPLTRQHALAVGRNLFQLPQSIQDAAHLLLSHLPHPDKSNWTNINSKTFEMDGRRIELPPFETLAELRASGRLRLDPEPIGQGR